jgi:hypothetical protein
MVHPKIIGNDYYTHGGLRKLQAYYIKTDSLADDKLVLL